MQKFEADKDYAAEDREHTAETERFPVRIEPKLREDGAPVQGLRAKAIG